MGTAGWRKQYPEEKRLMARCMAEDGHTAIETAAAIDVGSHVLLKWAREGGYKYKSPRGRHNEILDCPCAQRHLCTGQKGACCEGDVLILGHPPAQLWSSQGDGWENAYTEFPEG